MSIRKFAWVAFATIMGFAVPATGSTQDCGGGCAADGRACFITVRAEARGCFAACTAAPLDDALACRMSCRRSARAARRECRADFGSCLQGCSPACAACGVGLASCVGDVGAALHGCANGCAGNPTCLDGCAGAASTGRTSCRRDFAGCLDGCDSPSIAAAVVASPVELVPPKPVTALPGQTVYLTYVLVNHGPTVTLRYDPSFLVNGAGSVRSISGKPSSSGQTLSHNASKSIKVGVGVASDAPGGTIDVLGVFAFTAPETVTIRATGRISVQGLPTIAARCRTQLVGDHSVRVSVEVVNQSRTLVKAIRITRAVFEETGGARFTVTSGRSPSVVFSLAPFQSARFSFGGGWNRRGVLRIFEAATATTRLNRPIASDLVECTPPLVGR